MSLLDSFQNMIADVPTLVQPLISALAGTVPFIEGEGGAVLGVVAGITPVVAVIAAAAGNFLCVLVLVLLSSRTREAVIAHRRKRVFAHAGGVPAERDLDAAPTGEPMTRREQKVMSAFEKYGVPGVSLLGPLLVPTQITATTLAAIGISRRRILIWQGIAILLWTTFAATLVSVVLHFAA